jgi:hypothetical protein
MNILYVIFGSVGFNILILLYLLIFGKFSWFQLKARFMKNPVQINVINNSGKIRSKLINASNENVQLEHKIRHCPKDYALFHQGIAQYFYNEDDAEPLTFGATDGINPEYLSNLLIQAELNGANSFLKNLVKINIFIIVLAIMSVILIVCLWKIIEIDKATVLITNFISAMNTTTISV